MSTTQTHLAISDIADDILLLKDGGGALVLQVNAVNFGLLSEREQVAIISTFAQMLNSLSFSIQIVIHSERLNISNYIAVLDTAQKAQTNPLLSRMIIEYKKFIQSTIKENEVLDKKFYVVIPLFSLELGLTASRQILEQKIKTVLIPRRDQIIRQLNRVGLKSTQVGKQKLVELFYDIYNGPLEEKQAASAVNPQQLAVKLKSPAPIPVDQSVGVSAGQQTGKAAQPPTNRPAEAPNARPAQQLPPIPSAQPAIQTPIQSTQTAKTHPFVVEELEE